MSVVGGMLVGAGGGGRERMYKVCVCVCVWGGCWWGVREGEVRE